MTAFDTDFLSRVKAQKQLTDQQFEALVAMCDCDGIAWQAAERIQCSEGAVKTRMTQVYPKFGLGGRGRDKFQKLKNWLLEERQKQPSTGSGEQASLPDVQKLRSLVEPDIKRRCGTMRVLDMERPIELGSIYTEVNVLEKLTANQRCSQQELIEQITGGDSPEEFSFDRFGLTRVRQKRVPGLEAVERNRALMVLGKPGAGKTTFLKYLAIACKSSDFLNNQIPIFVTLKEFAETDGQPSLLEFIATQWFYCGVRDADELVGECLKAGQGLVLLDGLDEVRSQDHDRVIREIKELGDRYAASNLIATCRIAAKEYIFERFVEVEVADFGDKEIREFAVSWFTAKKDTPKIESFIERLNSEKSVKELASSPLLLTLLCLVFGEAGDLPSNRAELYKEGVDLLLRKWDGKRNIQRSPIYKNLSNQRKENLLGQLALATFERGEYFFKQGIAEEQILDYIRNLPGAKEDPEALRLDSEQVLKAIESQHGLLVERARGIYSFSHLTFHEYFTAKAIADQQAWDILSVNLTQKRWREVMLLTAGTLREGNLLVQHLKEYIDQMLAHDSKLQNFLEQILLRTKVAISPYKESAVRAFYLAYEFARTHVQAFNLELVHSLAPELTLTRALALDLDLTLDLNLSFKLAQQTGKGEMVRKLEKLRNKIKSFQELKDFNDKKVWWEKYGASWIQQRRTASIEHRNIGHRLQFDDEQKQKLQQYYDANLLLVECLDSDCYVSLQVRQEIDDTLLLPIAEIKRYKAERS